MISANVAEAHEAAARRLLDARGSIRRAFDELDTGMSFADLTKYVEPWMTETVSQPNAKFQHGHIVGLIAGAALTIVESDRKRRAT